MGSQRLNRYTSKVSRSSLPTLKRSQLLIDRPICDLKTGFIQHPAGFPIEVKRRRFWEKPAESKIPASRIGIMFDSDIYFKPGTYIDITIPLPEKDERFTGRVVLVKKNGEDFEIGLSLLHEADASRARIVEQLCHIEVYMQEKKYRDGPYNLNPDRVAREWITKYASDVPSL